MIRNKGWRSLGELLMIPRISEVTVSRSRDSLSSREVAVCCSRDSLSSRRHASSSPRLLRHQVPSRLIRPCLIRHPRLGQPEVCARCDPVRDGGALRVGILHRPSPAGLPLIAAPQGSRSPGQCHFGTRALPIRAGVTKSVSRARRGRAGPVGSLAQLLAASAALEHAVRLLTLAVLLLLAPVATSVVLTSDRSRARPGQKRSAPMRKRSGATRC
jgi:hypothetical protein